MKQIPLFKPKFNTERSIELIRECLDIGWTGIGFRTEQFEAQWSRHVGAAYSHFLNSSTAGLHLAVQILASVDQWPSDSEIITTPLTFISTNHAILYNGYLPIFADCDPSGNLSVESVLASITPKTRCVVFVGLGGNFGHLPEIAAVCNERGIRLIVDAAHMAGSTFEGKTPNSFGDITVYSFQAVKNLPTGDSGMICCADPVMDSLARKLSWLGIDKDTFQRSKDGAYKWDYDVPILGYKYHGNSLMASIALAQLDVLEADNQHRRKVFSWYHELLDQSHLRIITHRNEASSSRHLVQVCVDNREALMLWLSEHGVGTGVHYKDNTLYPMYRDCPSRALYVRKLWPQMLSLPCHLGLDRQDVQYICETINAFWSSESS